MGVLMQGVGDEVALVLPALGACLVVSTILWWSGRRSGNQRVHPDQQPVVSRARAQLNMENTPQDRPEGRDGPQGRQEGRDGSQGRQEGSAELLQCPICLGAATYPVETNCGHVFCGECILAYWHSDRWPRACRCAVCRREVTLLLPDPRLNSLEQFSGVSRQVSSYNQRMSGEPRPLMSYLYDVPTLLRHMWRDLFTVHGLLWITRLHILLIFSLPILYLLLPLDILPEAVFGVVGLLDDFLIMAGALIYITLIYRAHVTNTL